MSYQFTLPTPTPPELRCWVFRAGDEQDLHDWIYEVFEQSGWPNDGAKNWIGNHPITLGLTWGKKPLMICREEPGNKVFNSTVRLIGYNLAQKLPNQWREILRIELGEEVLAQSGLLSCIFLMDLPRDLKVRVPDRVWNLANF